jgi:hypothetical protein
LINDSRAKYRQSECTPEQQLKFVDASTGLFHLQVNLLVMLYRVHRGAETDMCSLSRWLDVLGRDKEKIWDSHKEYIKDFRGCHDFFQTVLDGYILGYLAHSGGYSDIGIYLETLSSDSKKAENGIIDFVKRLLDFTAVSTWMTETPDRRDKPHENLWLFLQHGMMYRFLSVAMRQGDPGRVISSLRYFTIWLQASNQHQYAAECLHLSACLTTYWSGQYKEFWMRNCLINLSGKREGFRACDAVCEHLIREIKAIVPNNVTEATLQYLFEKISPQIFFLRDIRRKMILETGAPSASMHSSVVSAFVDAKTVASALLDGNMYELFHGRGSEETPQVDLHGEGQTKLAFGECIEKYKSAMETRQELPREEEITLAGVLDYDSDEDMNRDWIMRM